MAILDLQRQGQQIGRLRIGQQVKAANGKMRPAKLDCFRFTTQSRHTADAIAALYGGTVQDWNGEFEVFTSESALSVTIPPRDQIVSQWYEMWTRGGASRRCDSQTNTITGTACLCPHSDDPDDAEQVERAALERSRLSKLNPPQACKLVTRISVMIPDLPGLGVFRLDTHSYYAAVEIGDAAHIMQMARDAGVFLPAILRIAQRSRVANGKTTQYPVPVLEVTATFRQIASGALTAGGINAQLPPAPGAERLALTSGQPAAAPSPQPAPVARPLTAQEIADKAQKATTRPEVEALAKQAQADRLGDDLVCVGDDVYEELTPYLKRLWRDLAPAAPPRPAAADLPDTDGDPLHYSPAEIAEGGDVA